DASSAATTSATCERFRGTVQQLFQDNVMLEIRREILRGGEGWIDQPRVLEQRMARIQRTASVRGPPFGFQGIDSRTRSIDELLDMLRVHGSEHTTLRVKFHPRRGERSVSPPHASHASTPASARHRSTSAKAAFVPYSSAMSR